MIGSLARTLMKKAIQLAGDGTQEVSITILGDVVYDPATGEYTRSDSTMPIGRGLMGQVSEAEVAKYRLENTTHKATVSMVDYEASGSPQLPETSDRLLIDGVVWLVDKVRFGSMNQHICFYVCEANDIHV